MGINYLENIISTKRKPATNLSNFSIVGDIVFLVQECEFFVCTKVTSTIRCGIVVIRISKEHNYKHIRWYSNDARKSRCQYEFRIFEKNLQLTNDMSLPPLRILSFDIECVNERGHFPQPARDPVFQICAILWDTKSKKKDYIGLTLGTCNSLEKLGYNVLCYKDEKNLLYAWRDLILFCDPDILTGYNIDQFDNPYITDRAKAIGCHKDFCRYTRIYKTRNRFDIHGKNTISSFQCIINMKEKIQFIHRINY